MATTYTNLLYHLVFSTKERRPLMTASMRAELYPYIGGIIRRLEGVQLEIGGVADHVHLLVKLRQDVTVADVLRDIKASSSGWLGERPDLGQWLGWQNGYGAFTVSASQVSPVREYIRNQEAHHRRLSFKEEFVRMLRANRVEYDEQYLWD